MAAKPWELSLWRNITGKGAPEDFQLSRSRLERTHLERDWSETDLGAPAIASDQAVVSLEVPARDQTTRVEVGSKTGRINVVIEIGSEQRNSGLSSH